MLTKTFPICLFLFIPFSIFAQKNFIDAVVYKNNGDSIVGQINYQEWYINPNSITFKASNATKVQEFTPKDLKKFVIKSKNEIYESATFKVQDKTSHDLDMKDASPSVKDALQSLKYREDTAFLLVIEKGRASLYSYIDQKTVEHFFVKKDNGFYIELMNLTFKIKEKSGKHVIANAEDYKTRLKDLSSDCPKMEKDIKGLTFFQDNLALFINAYNDCVGKAEYSKKNGITSIKYYVTTGIIFPSAFVSGITYAKFNTIKGKPYIPIGVGLELRAKRELNPVRLGAELNFLSSEYDVTESNGDRTNRHEAKLVGLNFQPFFKYSLYSKRITGHSAYFKAGIALSYYFKANYTKSYLVPANLFAPDVFTLHKTSGVFTLAGGYKIKNWFLEARFEPYAFNLITSSNDSDVFRTIRFGFMGGYVF